MSEELTARAVREIEHGRKLAQGGPEWLWGWGGVAGRRRADRRAAMIARGARLGPGRRALEIGCGTGVFTEKFGRTGAQLVAVELSADLLERARERIHGQGMDNVQFLHKRFEDCTVDGPFDAVIGSSVLHHLEIEESLRKIYDLLRPGGTMCFAEPNMLNPQVFIERKAVFLRPWLSYVSPDETAFVRWGLRRILTDIGFIDVEIVPHDWLHPALPRQFVEGACTVQNVLENLPLLREFAGSLYIRAVHPV